MLPIRVVDNNRLLGVATSSDVAEGTGEFEMQGASKKAASSASWARSQ